MPAQITHTHNIHTATNAAPARKIGIALFILSLILSLTALLSPVLASASPTVTPSRFVFVNFDVASAATLGDFPSRATVAKVLTQIQAAAPKAVALKFFYDSPGVVADTDQLISAISQGRTLLQASLNTEPPNTDLLEFIRERVIDSGDMGLFKRAGFECVECAIHVRFPSLCDANQKLHQKSLNILLRCFSRFVIPTHMHALD
jgi:CHASE2 domain